MPERKMRGVSWMALSGFKVNCGSGIPPGNQLIVKWLRPRRVIHGPETIDRLRRIDAYDDTRLNGWNDYHGLHRHDDNRRHRNDNHRPRPRDRPRHDILGDAEQQDETTDNRADLECRTAARCAARRRLIRVTHERLEGGQSAHQ